MFNFVDYIQSPLCTGLRARYSHQFMENFSTKPTSVTRNSPQASSFSPCLGRDIFYFKRLSQFWLWALVKFGELPS